MSPNKPNLTLIRGGKLSPAEFSALLPEEKLAHLRELPAQRRLELIIDDPDGEKLVRGFSPQEYYLMIKEIGETDASQLLANGSAEQLSLCLDLELWQKWEFNNEKAIEWLEYLLSADSDAMKVLSRLDPELLQLLLLDEIELGGGSGELATDSERLGDWDHSFDSMYFLTFKNDKHARIIGTLIDVIYRNDHELYLDLMAGCRSAVKNELEDHCYRFRSGRLADLGFPSHEEAIEIYAPLSPDRYTPGEEKIPVISEMEGLTLSIAPLADGTLLSGVLAKVMTEPLRQELEGLLNCAMVAEGGYGLDGEKARSVAQRVYGWLNLALEYLSGSDESYAANILRTEQLKRLFRLGFGIVRQVGQQARSLASDEYATAKALRGFGNDRPLFYRGLDADRTDGYREFGSMKDVEIAREFLNLLKR
ncbi:hypothetical protein OR1_03031 [Geobacter sp. OR-1]|uniref:DUF6178 family protein n=1 Tax=Geobacter sp. OR-1 TaxID=1266765 RepID=UPI0005423F01|nr:DUF6178 family protein [Geobacter sp. OR-1]GAM10737.1 hypothetical protein OR1_03031 [Geobacter sp. OR-1]